LTHQIEIAGKIAQFLGESTAEGEKLLEHLVKVAQENPTGGDDRKNSWLKDTYTST